MEFGSSPHLIRMKRLLLRFRSRSSGKVVFAREVKHPGYPAQRIVSKTTRDVVADVIVTARRTLGAILGRRG